MDFWDKFKFPIVTAALLLTGLSLFSLYARKDVEANALDRLVLEVVGPVQEAFNSVGDAFSSVWRRYFALVHTSQKNEELDEQISVLRGQLVRLRELERENIRLRKLLEIEPTLHYPLIAAEVVGMDPSNYFRTATLNKGHLDGVSAHMPVIDSRGGGGPHHLGQQPLFQSAFSNRP